MTETEALIERLINDIDTIQADMAAISKMAAANDLNGSGDPLVAARKLLENRELLKLKRGTLYQARQQLEVERSIASQAQRDADRDRICELTDQLESEAKKMMSTIKKLGKHFVGISDCERQIKALGISATDWPSQTFQHHKPGESAYRFLINALTTELQLSNYPINAWPSQFKASQLADPAEAFRDYLYQREEWLCRTESVAQEATYVS
jgi:hypothetical protein